MLDGRSAALPPDGDRDLELTPVVGQMIVIHAQVETPRGWHPNARICTVPDEDRRRSADHRDEAPGRHRRNGRTARFAAAARSPWIRDVVGIGAHLNRALRVDADVIAGADVDTGVGPARLRIDDERAPGRSNGAG